VRRAHALIRRHSGTVWIEDLGSTGGTSVNGQAVTGAHALRHGDVVRFGPVETRFEDRGAQMSRDDDTVLMEVPDVEDKPVLSPRQQEVLQYLKEGLTNPEIATRLGVTERTVKAHCQEVFDRLGARNRTAAVAAAKRLGLLSKRSQFFLEGFIESVLESLDLGLRLRIGRHRLRGRAEGAHAQHDGRERGRHPRTYAARGARADRARHRRVAR
jgi:DNA-binding CsgD family transcriptional regulator